MLQLVFYLVSVFCFSSVHSRTLEEIPKTSVFDVSASIQKTVEILSFNHETFQQEEESQYENSSSLFTLKLYSRDTLPTSPFKFKNYRDLTISRLDRDSIRVNFLYNKLNSDKTSQFEPMDLETPVTSGRSQGSGEYFARIGFGTPSKQLYIALDTGSDITWIQCAPCFSCYQQSDPIFNPSMSSSYKQLTCDSQQCGQVAIRGCKNDTKTCLYGVRYGDGSFTVGDFVTETLMFGSSPSNNIAIGCGRNNQGLFRASAGLFGLGRGPLSFPSQIKMSSFSYCLVDKDSTSASTLEFGSSNAVVTAPLLSSSTRATFYYVGMTGISVGGQMLSIPSSTFAIDSSGNGGVIVDSGTAITRFIPEVYNKLRDEFVKGTTDLPSAGRVLLFDTCYDLKSKPNHVFPSVAFHFGAASLTLPSKNYIYPVGNNIFCLGFASDSLSIIGNFQQQGIRVSYDVGRSTIGFSPSKC